VVSNDQPLRASVAAPVPILAYHSVSADPADWITPFAVSPQVFAAHLDAVAASGREPITVSHYADALRGRSVMPDRPVLITVDDGFADFADHALPALAERNMPSTLYVTTGALADQQRECVLPPATMLRRADLAGLEAAGVEIGAHSHAHWQLDLLADHTVEADLARCRDLLTDTLGHHIRTFAYPHGYWRRSIRRLVGEAGFDSACAVGNSLCSARDHPLALSRLMIRAGDGASVITAWMNGDPTRTLPRRRRVPAFGWRQYRRFRQWHHPSSA
jgi:peptidoglycan/xylan/chitin deacetylase (PgdA/CDA1 family)